MLVYSENKKSIIIIIIFSYQNKVSTNKINDENNISHNNKIKGDKLLANTINEEINSFYNNDNTIRNIFCNNDIITEDNKKENLSNIKEPIDYLLKLKEINFFQLQCKTKELIIKKENENEISKIINKPNKENIPNPLRHSMNTCFLVSILHCIRTNYPLLNFFEIPNEKNSTFLPVLKRVINQTNGSICREDVIELLKTDHSYENYGFQNDPIDTLNAFFENHTSLDILQFVCVNNFTICKYGCIEGFNSVNYKYNEILSRNNYPILNFYFDLNNKLQNIINGKIIFNLQNILKGEKIENSNCRRCQYEEKTDSCLYNIPFISNASPFLIFLFTYPYTDYNIDDKKLGNNVLITFQDKIKVLSVLDKETEYVLTGFIVCKILSKYINHYIAYVKYNDEWYKCDNESIKIENISFPITYNKSKSFISQLFYRINN